MTEVLLEDGANLSHLKIQRESPRAFHVGTIEAEQKRDSHYQSFSFATGAALSRTNMYTTLDGEGAARRSTGSTCSMASSTATIRRRSSTHSRTASAESCTRACWMARRTACSTARCTSTRSRRRRTASRRTSAAAVERAQVDTKPQLEIFADDVKCTHGATVGRIDQTALFYMKSRGINKELARRLLTYAFAAEVLETIEIVEFAKPCGRTLRDGRRLQGPVHRASRTP